MVHQNLWACKLSVTEKLHNKNRMFFFVANKDSSTTGSWYSVEKFASLCYLLWIRLCVSKTWCTSWMREMENFTAAGWWLRPCHPLHISGFSIPLPSPASSDDDCFLPLNLASTLYTPTAASVQIDLDIDLVSDTISIIQVFKVLQKYFSVFVKLKNEKHEKRVKETAICE